MPTVKYYLVWCAQQSACQPLRRWALQVAYTDLVPAYILGGSIITLGAGGMTTDAARNATLTLVVAFPSGAGDPTPPHFAGPGCPAAADGSVAACGHMYLDGGEELELGGALDNYITLSAESSEVCLASSSDNFPAMHTADLLELGLLRC